VLGNRRRAEQDVAEPGAQEKDHIFGRGLVQAGLQREHRVELGLLDQAELDQQRAELAVVLGLVLKRGVEARARHQPRSGQELAKAEVGGRFGSFGQGAA
jgi:hypothetical protein